MLVLRCVACRALPRKCVNDAVAGDGVVLPAVIKGCLGSGADGTIYKLGMETTITAAALGRHIPRSAAKEISCAFGQGRDSEGTGGETSISSYSGNQCLCGGAWPVCSMVVLDLLGSKKGLSLAASFRLSTGRCRGLPSTKSEPTGHRFAS